MRFLTTTQQRALLRSVDHGSYGAIEMAPYAFLPWYVLAELWFWGALISYMHTRKETQFCSSWSPRATQAKATAPPSTKRNQTMTKMARVWRRCGHLPRSAGLRLPGDSKRCRAQDSGLPACIVRRCNAAS